MTCDTEEREYGLVVELLAICENCGDVSEWSSPPVKNSKTVSSFVVNILAARAMVSTGNQQTAMNDVFAAMNISHCGLHNETWQGCLKQKLAPSSAVHKLMGACALSVKSLYGLKLAGI